MSDGSTSDRAQSERELAELMQEMLDDVADGSTADSGERFPFEFWEKSFGERVKQWRRARNWSQEDLAERLRVHGFEMHQTTVAKIERGARPLRVAEAAAIATVFRAPPLAVFLGRPPENVPWPLQQLHEAMAMAEERLAYLKQEMEASAARYVAQQADVYDLARILNEVALEAEKRNAERLEQGEG